MKIQNIRASDIGNVVHQWESLDAFFSGPPEATTLGLPLSRIPADQPPKAPVQEIPLFFVAPVPVAAVVEQPTQQTQTEQPTTFVVTAFPPPKQETPATLDSTIGLALAQMFEKR